MADRGPPSVVAHGGDLHQAYGGNLHQTLIDGLACPLEPSLSWSAGPQAACSARTSSRWTNVVLIAGHIAAASYPSEFR